VLSLVFFALAVLPFSDAHTPSLHGLWEGDGYVASSGQHGRMEYCDSASIELEVSASAISLKRWDNCSLDWSLEDLVFEAGIITRFGREIGNYTESEFEFSYDSPKSGLSFRVHGRVVGDALLLDEYLSQRGAWWSRANYKHRRKR
jgi:hypothetical protein